MKKTLSELAALYRRSEDQVQSQRYERLATQSLDERYDDALLELARQLDANCANPQAYLERAKLYMDMGDSSSDEWEQADRDLTKTIEIAGNDDLLAEAYAMRAHLRMCSERDPTESPFEDVRRAIHHGASHPDLFKDLAGHYSALADSDDVDRLGEAISLYIAGLYYDLQHEIHEEGREWRDGYGLLADLAAAYDRRAETFRRKGKPVEAFEDEDKARWLKIDGKKCLQEMNQESDDIEFPQRIASDCPLL